MAKTQSLLRSQQTAETTKEWYNAREAVERTGYSEWTLRQACNKGRIEPEKGADGKWRISHEVVTQIQNAGLPE